MQQSSLLFRFLLFALALAPVPALATQNINTEVLSNSVVYLYGTDANGNADPNQPLGTGFIVRVPETANPQVGFYVLVTARHIIDPAWRHCPGSSPNVIYLRLNKKGYDPVKQDSGVTFARVLLYDNGAANWAHPSEDDADVAVVVLNANVLSSIADFSTIALSDFVTEQEAERVKASDSIISVGLLPSFPGVKRNYPVFKFGFVSTKPEETIPTQCVAAGVPTYLRLWLLSINLIPGNSGSPILYVAEGANGVSLGGRSSLIGLQSISFIGADVSGMTPARYIFETIKSLNLRDANLYRGAAPAPGRPN